MPEKFRQLLEESERIFITSHISPDGDAVSSLLLLGRSVKHNYPGKEIMMALEEKPSRPFGFLTGYREISFGSLLEQVKAAKPDLFIIVDAMDFGRISRFKGAELNNLVKSQRSRVVIIDHHSTEGQDGADVYVNEGLSATSQQIYKLLFKDLALKKPAGYAEAVLLGIVSDTQRFKYDNPRYRQTFEAVSELVDDGASIETLVNKMERYSLIQLRTFSNLAKNAVATQTGYSYSFIDDDFPWDNSNGEYAMGCDMFINKFIRNIEGNTWGFVIYPDISQSGKKYAVSFRSVAAQPDVSLIAESLGGGGHKSAAGAKRITADTVQAAVQQVESAIRDAVA